MSIKVAIAGVGNCASSLVQGVEYYKKNSQLEAASPFNDILSTSVKDIEFVAAFDVDVRKVDLPLSEAIFSKPNCTLRLCTDINIPNVIVRKSKTLDGISSSMANKENGFIESRAEAVDVAEQLKISNADVLVCYLPVGSKQALKYFCLESLKANCAFINCVPVFISEEKNITDAYKNANLPLIGDDIKSQVGATAIHRALLNLLSVKGANILKTFQLNYGGNSDFLNMRDASRLEDKKKSKTNAAKSAIKNGLVDNIHVSPTDYIHFLEDRKEAIIDIKWQGWANVEMSLKTQLIVEDSPNSAAIVADAIQLAFLAKKNKVGGLVQEISAYCMKSPPVEVFDDISAYNNLVDFIKKMKNV